jgi:bromodomain-containing factor 1
LVQDETTTASEINLTTPEIPAENVAINPKVNGSDNLDAFSSNQSILANESQPTEISPSSAPNSSSQLFDTNTTTSEAARATSPDEARNNNNTLGLAASESAIDLAVEDVAPASAVPPVVDAPESDLRNMSSPPAPTESVQDPVTEQLGIKNLPTSKLSQPDPTSHTTKDTTRAGEEQVTMELESDVRQPASIFGDGVVNDTTMTEAPAAKIAREREDDDEAAPSAKRTKTEESAKGGQSGESAVVNGKDASFQQPQGPPITEYQSAELVKALRTMASRGNGKNFRGPVVELWPAFADAYRAKIMNPMDLATMQVKLTGKYYHNMEEVKADARLIHENAMAFNGVDHTITKAAAEIRKAIESRADSLPAEQPVPVKKDKKKRVAPPPSAAARAPAASPRRQSHSSQVNTAPVLAEPTPAYSLPPSGVPPARRGSAIARPKRDINPPKNKGDLIYDTKRSKSKKGSVEFRFCEEVLSELQKQKYAAINGPFLLPVDPVALGIPNYFAIIKKPMDLSTISSKLKEGSYQTAGDFEKDVKLMFSNCYKFNPPGNVVHSMGRQLQDVFEDQWAKKDQWMADHAPVVASPANAPDTEDEEEDDDDEDEVPDKSIVSAAKERLLEEQTKLINMMRAKHLDQPMIQMQQEMVELIQKKVHEEEANAKKKTKKPKAPKPVKKAAPVKKSGPAPKKAGKQARYMGTLEKETISNGLGSLPDHLTTNVLEWIQTDQGNLAVSYSERMCFWLGSQSNILTGRFRWTIRT